jgi:hypothetical protein
MDNKLQALSPELIWHPMPSQVHTVNPLHDRDEMALRLRDFHSYHPSGFPGLTALVGSPMSGVVDRCEQSEELVRTDKHNRK